MSSFKLRLLHTGLCSCLPISVNQGILIVYKSLDSTGKRLEIRKHDYKLEN